MYGNNDPNELLICPYDPVHRVAAKRFPYHLQKCRKVGDENMAASRSNDLESKVRVVSDSYIFLAETRKTQKLLFLIVYLGFSFTTDIKLSFIKFAPHGMQ